MARKSAATVSTVAEPTRTVKVVWPGPVFINDRRCAPDEVVEGVDPIEAEKMAKAGQVAVL